MCYRTLHPEVFGEADWRENLARRDLATFAYPSDAEAQRRLRFDVYLAECVVLALCTLGHILGVIESLFLSAAWSTGFRSPVTEAVVEAQRSALDFLDFVARVLLRKEV